MFDFQLSRLAGRCKVRFQHSTIGTRHGFRRVTIATIENKRGQVLATGSATCHEKDNFSKSVGRKLSLARAIGPVWAPHVRKKIWKAYFEKSPIRK
jgi:hypothetical protein